MLVRVVGANSQEKLTQTYRPEARAQRPLSEQGANEKAAPEGGFLKQAVTLDQLYIGSFLPPLYEYRVTAAFFISPFGSKEMLAVTPL